MESAMRDIRTDMKVIDSTGAELGTVETFKMGDPEAVTAEGQGGNESQGLAGSLIDTVSGGDLDVPPQLAEQLLRTGYIKIDSKGLFSKDLYVAADGIDRVENDTVFLNRSKDQLFT